MHHVRHITIVLFLAVSVLAGTPEESLSYEQSSSQGTAADGTELTLEPQQVPVSSLWRHPLARMTKRRVHPSPLFPVTCNGMTPMCHFLVGHSRRFSVTVGDGAIPRYQFFHVYRC
jgi:hypothetical protein